ncbi:hypothetical protein [Chryseobacterium sp. MFBS3-17]|uniref:hypothetical protein n=1 Tax=Chryseobacterium sp. MFBS3-17 TaxID=2886689 RepID=UPI001D0EB620|nr:hypothetical protein [Chryseobacterium sp. MFBS3-17]MCC2591018.1 hypothetical protein [Chryseobacterium sp. MFBS3-17]
MNTKGFSIMVFILLLGCSQKETSPAPESPVFTRSWKVERYPYSNAMLTISPDYRFTYYETGHTSESFSGGIWKQTDDTLILTSTRPAECLIVDDFALKDNISPDSLKTTIKDCVPAVSTSFFTDFRSYRFIIRGDSLIFLDLNPEYQRMYGNYKIY